MVSFCLFRWFCSLVSFPPFCFVVLGFSTCPDGKCTILQPLTAEEDLDHELQMTAGFMLKQLDYEIFISMCERKLELMN